MKKYLAVLILLFASSFAYSQKNDTCDYFSIGVYGGNYTNRSILPAANDYINSVSGEFEYRQSADFAFFISALYQFTNNDVKLFYDELMHSNYSVVENPRTYTTVITIGARYYLSHKNVNPYLSLGISKENSSVGKFNYKVMLNINDYQLWEYETKSFKNLSVLTGAGLNVRLCDKFLFDFQYNVYQSIEKNDGTLVGYTILGGLKYNF